MLLTPYDEFPVHQSPYPFSHVPSTDYNWDDGYFFSVFEPSLGLFCQTGLRINPNADLIGGYAMLNIAGQQYTVRFSRVWRRDFNLAIGPLSYVFEEPLRRIRLRLAPNDSDLDFDLLWEAVSPAALEEHHVAHHRGRRTTDQSRYCQAGTGTGRINFRGERFEVTPDRWNAARDHSWGLYAERPPLAPLASHLPPRQSSGPRRALRIWTVFNTPPFSGFYHLHETEDGVQCQMDDVFGTPFGGRMETGWDKGVDLVAGSHELAFHPGTRVLKSGVMTMRDADGGVWRQEVEAAAPPWLHQTIGYTPGSWKDGGSFQTYHGSEDAVIEWDEFDFSRQPCPYTPYKVTGAAAADGFGTGANFGAPVCGVEYCVRMRTTAPDGTTATGSAMWETYVNGRFTPYGFE